MSDETLAQVEPETRIASGLALSVVVPVYNLAGSIVANVDTIRERIASALDGQLELIVVSDGSVDQTEERLLEARGESLRVIHYDRNLGKGYAVKAGALAARAPWIAFVDADLDLDPAAIPIYLEHARRQQLDFVIGSKRHPDSVVQYPRSRRVASWGYQQLGRLLFDLDVRDTQVGLKVFRGEVADEVIPLLLVKRYAFDLELLAVAASLGYDRIEEQPVELDYRFTGSGVGSIAVLRALVDTAAIFYRLRVLGYYGRMHRLLGESGHARASAAAPLVSLVGGDESLLARLDYERVELVDHPGSARGDVLAFLADGAVPAGNWLSSTVSLLRTRDVGAVVTPTVAPSGGTTAERGSAAIWESRLGGGSLYFRFTPGNLRYVVDFPTRSAVLTRDAFLAVADPELPPELLCERLVVLGHRILYTPETVVVAPQPPLVRPHFREVVRYARERARSVRRRGLRGLRPSTLGPLLLVPLLAAAAVLLVIGGPARIAGVVVLASYAATIAAAALVAALRFRSLSVGLAVAAFLPLTHVVYAGSFAVTFARSPGR